MPRIRTIKPEFFTSEAVADWHPITRLVFMGLLVHAEDNGVGPANERLLASLIFPMDDRDDAIAWTRRALDECSRGGQIVLYEASGRHLFAVANWGEHQRIDRPSKTRYPRPTDAQVAESFANANATTCENVHELTLVEPSTSTRRALDEPSSLEGKGKEGKGTTPPSFVGGGAGGVLAVQPPLLAEVVEPPSPPAPAAKPNKSQGSRLAEDWLPSPTTQAWSRDQAQATGLNITEEWAKFRDYWLGRAGAGARKADWDRTWRNWVRKANDDHRRRSGRSPSGLTKKDQRVADILAMGQRMQAAQCDSPALQRKALDW